jgi:hypothetical protein
MKNFLILSFVLTVLLFACKHDSLIPGGTAPPGITPPPAGAATICFETDVLPVFVSNCAKSGCHDAVTHKENLRYDSYAEIMKTIKANNPSDSKAWEVILENRTDKRMPPPPAEPLSKAQKDSIYKWIVQGAPNTSNCNNACDTTFFTYSGAILPILQASCIGCHSGTPASGNIDLSTYANVKITTLNGKLIGSVTHATGFKPMPQAGNKLPDCKITQIKKWVNAGAPNN